MKFFDKLDKIHKDMITSPNITDSTIDTLNDLIVWDFGKYNADDVSTIDTVIDLMIEKMNMSSKIEELDKLWVDYRTVFNKIPKPLSWANIINRLMNLRFKAIYMKYADNVNILQLDTKAFKIHNKFISRRLRKLIVIIKYDVDIDDNYNENFIDALLVYNYLTLDNTDLDTMDDILKEIVSHIWKKDPVVNEYIEDCDVDIDRLIEMYHAIFFMDPMIEDLRISIIKNLLILRLYFMRK